jgi:two-component system, response regulator YesN
MNILLVDDEVLVTRGLTMQIQKYQPSWTIVGQATNGNRALEIIKSHSIDVLITDIRMPQLDGLELTKRVKELQPVTKIIILSGYAEFEYARIAIRYGVNDFLLKPVDYSTIIDLIVEFEQKSRMASLEKLDMIDTAIYHIKKNFTSPTLSLTEVAELVGLTPPHFSKIFKKKINELYIDYLTRIRIERAQLLLQQQNLLKVYEIGEAVGYQDQHYFSQIFKKIVGVTPKQYREQKNKQIY